MTNNLELLFFIAALIYLFFKPEFSNSFSFCVLHNVGFEYCPGCGLGASIHYALHFDFQQSFEAHWLGIIALIIILLRTFSLIISLIRDLKYGQDITNDAGNRA